MNSIFDNDDELFEVVRNDEGQYSIWPINWDVPAGWTTVGIAGIKSKCLQHIETVWKDMRPQSLVRAINKTDE